MKADREPNRLPLRAGAMLLLAVAVVFIFLGAHRALSGDSDPAADLQEAGRSAQAESPDGDTGRDEAQDDEESPATSTTADAGDVPKLCVLNAGTVSGLAKKVSEQLESEGFTVGSEPANLSTSSITENTVFYGEGQQSAGEKLAAAVPGGATAEQRPTVFANCPGELVVVVVTDS